MGEKAPTAPKGTRASGRRLWSSVVDRYELEEHEAALLREAVRLVDLLDELQAVVDRDGPLLGTGEKRRVHPAAVEARQSRIALARVLAALRLPDADSGKRPQRRLGARGVYGIDRARTSA